MAARALWQQPEVQEQGHSGVDQNAEEQGHVWRRTPELWCKFEV
ncbi:uncharacterized protein G2W53_005813 [Senna tora]|uniref:Uncharacterized protein n=1 Tax=Senna tora TaxID=362788 RepID=A0A835CD81_9FABA|nr:uncharacterized protein G2W53_005813 [Senna tora]